MLLGARHKSQRDPEVHDGVDDDPPPPREHRGERPARHAIGQQDDRGGRGAQEDERAGVDAVRTATRIMR